jgi:NAD-dependent histone deacetylase SIR2
LHLAQARIARSARTINVGSLRPAIVLYNEQHPFGEEIASIQPSDLRKKPDMLIIIGTSLQVHGVKKLVKEFAKGVHLHASTLKYKKGKGKVVFVNRSARVGGPN